MSLDKQMGGHQLDAKLAEHIESRMSVVGDTETVVHHVPVTASRLMAYMAETLYDSLNQLSTKELPFTTEDVADTFLWLLYARVWYVSGGRSEVHPRDVEYPALLAPLLATIGTYKDLVGNVIIVPVPSESRDGALVDEKSGDLVKSSKLGQPEIVKKVITALRLNGVPTVFGLPMDKEVDSDEIYRLDVVDGVVRGTSSTYPNSHMVFARSMLQMTYLNGLFGNTRISYIAVSHMESAIFDLILRNIQGPRVNVS
jgi:hypothetical protein